MNIKRLSVFFIFLLILMSYYLSAYYFPKQKSTDFLERLSLAIEKNSEEFKISELTDFEWDGLDIIVQIDDSWDEGSSIAYIKARGYKYSFFKVLYLPRLLKREYESVFIFTKNKTVVNVVRLDTREIRVGDTFYYFDPIDNNSGDHYLVKISPSKEDQKWVQDKLGHKYISKLTFFTPRNKQEK